MELDEEKSTRGKVRPQFKEFSVTKQYMTRPRINKKRIGKSITNTDRNMVKIKVKAAYEQKATIEKANYFLQT